CARGISAISILLVDIPPGNRFDVW
nr:immunoglobulin heavy chain junction region [Macaca mulatta]MOV38510.1 immunoglobulin heavy chain junction region [Macaca mulatta]MOV38625.1 immunoglobulin heavy chain junction region [Macaca mulatta]MOV39356.1 immunoglobulin heavy chain junction region [Macaca mulatta]MOV39624.1 immunoglobulin heavy chain junction region [Macaca mulatta]